MVQTEPEVGGWWTRVLQLGQRSRRPWLIAASLALVLALAGAIGLKPFIRSQARQAAAKRGILLAVSDVSLGLRSVSLQHVGLSLKDVDVLRGDIEQVRVAFGWNLRPKAVQVTGGKVDVNGSVDKVIEQLERWRGQSGKAAASDKPARSGGLSLSATGLVVSWQGEPSSGGAGRLSGVSYVTGSPEGETLKVDALTASHSGVSLSVGDAMLVLGRQQGQRVLKELSAGQVDATVVLSQALPSPSAGTGQPDGTTKKTTPTAAEPKAASSSVSGKLGELLPDLDASRGARARRFVGRLADLARAKLPEASRVDLDKLSVTLVHGEERLHLGPNRFSLERSQQGVELALLPGTQTQASPLALRLSIPFESKAVRMSASGGPVSLASLGVKEGDFNLREVDRSQLALTSQLTLAPDGKALAISADGHLTPLSIQSAALSDELLRGTALRWNAKARALLNGTNYRIERWEMALGDVQFTLSGSIGKSADKVTAELAGGIPLASCQSLLDSAPEGLLPMLRGMKFSGTFALDAGISVDTADLGEMKVKWDFRNECRATVVPPELSPRRFLNQFRLPVKDVTGHIVSIETGPGTPGWTPYGVISPHMETAVLICEDGRFFRHQGFDHEAIENSIKENVKAGRFVRGASTISMQLAKNLYLSFDKTLSRKLQEAVLTTVLEQELSKQEMMELYLNVIEYGPGIYGIGAAAKHYFNTTPAELSLGQALYLASILPNPQQQHFTDSGALSEGWTRYLRRLMRIAVKIGRLSEAEYEAAMVEEVRFGEASVMPQGNMFLPEPPNQETGAFGELEGDLPEGL